MTTNDELMTELRSYRAQFDKLVERLYGSLDDPYEEAAIPRLLRNVDTQDKRIDVLEKDRVRIYTFTSILSFVAGLLSHFLNPFKH